MNRRIGLALLGFVGGAVAGVIAAFTAVWLWFDVLDMKGPGTGPKPGLDWLVMLGPVLMLVGGIAMAWWTLRRDRAGKSVVVQTAIGGVGVMLLVRDREPAQLDSPSNTLQDGRIFLCLWREVQP